MPVCMESLGINVSDNTCGESQTRSCFQPTVGETWSGAWLLRQGRGRNPVRDIKEPQQSRRVQPDNRRQGHHQRRFRGMSSLMSYRRLWKRCEGPAAKIGTGLLACTTTNCHVSNIGNIVVHAVKQISSTSYNVKAQDKQALSPARGLKPSRAQPTVAQSALPHVFSDVPVL